MTTPARSFWSRVADVANLFATPLRTSHYLELVNPLWTTHTLQARVEKVWDETNDSRTLTLRPGRNWRAHRAGQYIRVGVAIDGMQHTRTYSISSSPDREDGCITITVKAVEGGRVSQHLVRNVTPGAYLPIALPQGDFVLPEAMPVRPLFITAGSGITPVMSMLSSYVARGFMPDVTHLHYAPSAHDTIFGKELAEIAEEYPQYRLRPVYTRGVGPRRPSNARHFSAEQLAQLCPDYQEREVYACGPAALLDALEAHFTAIGRRHKLHLERFRAVLAPLPENAAGGNVRFVSSGREVKADGRANLLKLAEDVGLNPPHGCRMGICHSCDVTLVSGCVRDLRTGELHSEPGESVQICICAAAGDVALAL